MSHNSDEVVSITLEAMKQAACEEGSATGSIVDYGFVERLLKALAASGGIRRSLLKDFESDAWFEDQAGPFPWVHGVDLDPDLQDSDIFGIGRMAALSFTERLENESLREIIARLFGSSILLQAFEGIRPTTPFDFLLIAQVASRVFDQSEIVRLWRDLDDGTATRVVLD